MTEENKDEKLKDAVSQSWFKDWLDAAFNLSHNKLPGLCWMIEGGMFVHLEFMKHDDGCWAVLSGRQGGKENGRINLGTYTKKEDVENLIDALKRGI